MPNISIKPLMHSKIFALYTYLIIFMHVNWATKSWALRMDLYSRKQEFRRWTNRKRRGPRRNLEDVSPIIVSSPIFFHLNRVGNGNDNISSKEHFENSQTSTVEVPTRPITSYFCSKIWILSCDPVPLRSCIVLDEHLATASNTDSIIIVDR